MTEISIKAEELAEINGFKITNSFISSLFVLVIFFIIGFFYSKESKKRIKGNFYYLTNFLVKSIYQLFESVLGQNTQYFFPLLGSFFLFILFNNWFGLLPGVGSILYHHVPILRGANADLNTTLSLGILSVVLSQYFGIKFLGFKNYLSKFLNFSNPISFFTGILEIISEISKIISFSFRLFGNIFAGEVLLSIMAFLVPILASFPFLLLEIFVGFIQALVFSMLTAVFLNLAISKHH
ncbi:MAG: F0F1 ATP synthase subunit A [Microgenomates group bacterium]